jgi:hypothetical protein
MSLDGGLEESREFFCALASATSSSPMRFFKASFSARSWATSASSSARESFCFGGVSI